MNTQDSKKKPQSDHPDAMRLSAASVNGSRYALWHLDNRVTIRNRAWQVIFEGTAEDKPAFDAICVEWEIEPVRNAVLKRR